MNGNPRMARCGALNTFLAAVWAGLLVFALAGTGAAARTWTADNGNGTFSNPLFYDEFSDPDLIRVGSDYYMTGTTMHAMPGLPVLHSKDLVNWRLLSYAAPRLDFGPEYRLENGKEIYGQGVWAPTFRYRNGTFYIFDNVRGQPTQIFTARDPRGPWKRTPMKRGFHDLSVLFDEDGRAYVIWGYQGIRFAQLNGDLTDVVPGTERTLIPPDAGMGEGSHFYKINGKYYITSAWYRGTMRMPCARADRPEGPYEVIPAISGGEDFGIAKGAMHQGGIVSTPSGEWWGFSMMDFNSLGRLTGLSPVTWKDGWPYFGLPGNLGRSPRTWVKPKTGHSSRPAAPFHRSDDFSDPQLQPVWQWNHAPDDTRWSLTERPGFLRLHSLPAPEFWWARNTLTQRAVGPESTPTAELDTSGMKPGDVAGLGLLNSPYAWVGVSRGADGLTLEQFDKGTRRTTRVPLHARRVWLRARCSFFTEKAQFSYSTDGKSFQEVGEPFTMVFQLKTFQGVRYSLFHYNTGGAPGGYADFDRLTVDEPRPRGLTQPIPRGRSITLAAIDNGPVLVVQGDTLTTVPAADPVASGPTSRFRVVDRGLGRIALQSAGRFVSVGGTGEPGQVTLRRGKPGSAETFQWIETVYGDLSLLSLATHRYLRLHPAGGTVSADHAGPQRGRSDGVRLQWKRVTASGRAATGMAQQPKSPASVPSLRDAFRGKFLIGATLNYPALQGRAPLDLSIATTHFNAFTAENSMKPASLQPVEGRFEFADGDRLVSLAEQCGATPIGHVLVWHQQTPAWFFQGPDGAPASRELALARLRKHISTVVGHYKGRVKQWDVVNEAISDSPGELLRQSPWLKAVGEDYIAEAFRAAHAADPKAILIYNDYNIERAYKRPKALQLLKSLLQRKVPVHAVGIQGHWRMDNPDFAEVEESIRQYAALGLKVMITELDIGVLPTRYQGAEISTREMLTPEQRAVVDPYTAGLPDEVARQHAERYRQAFEMFFRHQDVIGRVTLWGTHDGGSWLNNFPVRGRTDYPLLFSRTGAPKPAFFAVREAAGTKGKPKAQ